MSKKSSQIRLNKFIAENTGVSRREADELISSRRVEIKEDRGLRIEDRKIAVLGQQISDRDQVFIDGKPMKNRAEHITIILNKPVGYLSSRRSQGGDKTVYDLLPTEYKSLKTAGRLDKDSSGLMILSSDGDLIQHLTHPRYQKTKVYEVELDKPLQPLHQQMISEIGIDLPDGKSRLRLDRIQNIDDGLWNSTEIRIKNNSSPKIQRSSIIHNPDSKFTRHSWRVTMHEGRNRQIRRTLSALGYDVTKLHRITLGKYSLDNLKPAEFKIVDL